MRRSRAQVTCSGHVTAHLLREVDDALEEDVHLERAVDDVGRAPDGARDLKGEIT